MLLIGILLGLYLMMRTGLPLLFIGLVGVLSTTLYYKFKYVALGDLMIFICYGLAIALGTVYVMTGQLVWAVLPVSAPLGLLIVAILHANNTRDIEQDRSAGIRTLAMNQGLEGAQVTYQAFLLTAYLLVALLVMLKLTSPYTFLVLLSFPLAMKNIRQMNRATMDYPGAIQTLDARTSLLVMLFGLLQVTGNVIAALT
jgi:1,4-dihydroxy-2-naphthoate octaprenyltransferase